MVSKSIDKYLQGYAEPELQDLSSIPRGVIYQNAFLIPAYLEEPSFLERLDIDLPESSGHILLVLVSNHPADLSAEKIAGALSTHRNLLTFLDQPCWQSGQLSLFKRENYDVLLVDRTGTYALPADQGVGLARKIGADLILQLIKIGAVASPWIMSTDADALLPKDYFSAVPDIGSSAISYPFEHTCDLEEPIGRATKLYEQSIKHYVEGLSFAGSDYAFSTLGSCLAFNSESYAQARGFPKRSGGEDFYLLNKLAKLGKIETDEDLPHIKITARESSRVPFGTGPAVSRLLNSPEMDDEPIFYNPGIFHHLKLVLEQIAQRPGCTEEINVDATTHKALIDLGIAKALEHANKQSLSGKQYDQHMKSWFDGFKTLRFVHYLRDQLDDNGSSIYPSLSYNELKTEKPL